MKTIIEIGANRGADTENLIKDEEVLLYAFEPTHELLQHELWPKFGGNPRVRIIPFAVDTKNSFEKFFIAGQSDWGCSSLHEFSSDLSEKWPGRSDFRVTHSYYVPTITLFDFCEIYKINSIDYLWIDAQGNDFNCLLSLKDKIKIVKSGKCEVSNTVELYKNTQNHIKIVKPWLESNGFEVEISYGAEDKECDLLFSRKFVKERGVTTL